MIAPCFLVLHLATLATDRLRQVEPILQGQPLAAWTTSGNRRLLTAVDAPKTTLHAGQALADARPCTVRSGIAAHAVISDIVDAAAGLARGGQHGLLVPPGRDGTLVEALPLSMLRLPPECVAGLHRLGLQRVGHFLRKPRAPLSRRFGRTLMDVLDALKGERP